MLAVVAAIGAIELFQSFGKFFANCWNPPHSSQNSSLKDLAECQEVQENCC